MKQCRACIVLLCGICIFAIITLLIYANLRLPITHIRVETSKTQPNVINVLIISYTRSGSSLLGEILSSINNSTYLFEPFHYLCKYANNYTCDSKNHQLSLEKMFNCDGDIMYEFVQKSFFPVVRQMSSLSDFSSYSPSQLSELCHRHRIHVIKTINVSILDAAELIENGNIPNLRVVHLLRDPRARYSSLQNGVFWSSRDKSVDNLCQRMVQDLVDSKHVPAHLYTRVRYEDVVQGADHQVTALFNRVYEQNYESETAVYISSHINNNNNNDSFNRPGNILSNIFNYFKTDKRPTINLEKWKRELSESTIDQIEKKCDHVLKEMNYY